MLFRLELCHAEKMAEDLELVAAGELDQFSNGFRDEGHGLVGAALSISIIRYRSPIPARSFALPAAPCLAQIICIQSNIVSPRNNPFSNATLGRISQLFRYKVLTGSAPFNICRFDRGLRTTHVRVETAAASLAEPALIFSRKLLE